MARQVGHNLAPTIIRTQRRATSAASTEGPASPADIRSVQQLLRSPRAERGDKDADPNELELFKSDADPADLPVSGGTVDTEAFEEEGAEEKGEAEAEPGETAEFSAELEPGEYVMICNIPGHYEDGMYGSLTVKDRVRGRVRAQVLAKLVGARSSSGRQLRAVHGEKFRRGRAKVATGAAG